MRQLYKNYPLRNHAVHILKLLSVILLLNMPASKAFSQAIKITGTVKDSQNELLPGVSIRIKGTSNGTVTNIDGAYSINVSNKNAVLVFSSIGFVSQEKTVVGNSIDVVLTAQSGSLNEVVVVGYGTQKKVDLTGSVATINGTSIQDRPITSLSNGLAGLAPGLYAHQTTGQPGSDGSSLAIRGISTLSSANVLVLVDGIQGRIDDVNPQDVESITILKDAASTAIYGTLGANGVILITTKKGSGKPTLTYSGIFSKTSPTRLPQYLSNSVQYMNLINEASTSTGGSVIYTPDIIQPYITAAQNPNGLTTLGIPNNVAYANTDWAKRGIQNNTLQNNNISLSGESSDKTRYLLTLGYIFNPGLISNSAYSDYRMRINVESKVNDYITVGTTTFANFNSYGEASSSDFLNYLRQTTPMSYPYYNGYYGIDPVPVDGSTGNVLSRLKEAVGNQTVTSLNTTWYLKANIIKGLSIEPRFNYSPSFNENNYTSIPTNLLFKNFQTNTALASTDQVDPTGLYAYNVFSKSYTLTMENLIRYNTTIAKDHNVGVLLGYNQYQVYAYGTSITAKGLIDGSVNAISTASSFPSNPTGSITSNYAFRSFFGRFNYDYKNKYILQASLRRDGSSRFGPQSEYGYFPSLSGGWNLDREPVIKKILDKADISTLKFRASYGRVGNVASGDYDWQALYGTTSYMFNSVPVVGLRQTKISNPDLHWETTAETNLGMDILALNSLTFTADWFNKNTSGILFTPPIDITVGTASAPTVNLAAVQAKGIEFQLGYTGNAGQLRYAVNGNFSYNYYNNVTQYKGPVTYTQGVNPVDGGVSLNNNISAVSAGSTNRIVQGHPINEYYVQTVYKGTGTYFKPSGAVDPKGGPKDGMIRTTADLNWVTAMQAAGYKFGPVNTVGPSGLYKGDLIYADNNNDGVYGNTADAKFQKVSTQPKYLYGLNLNLAYKGFNLSAVFAGAAGFDAYTQYDYVNSVFVRSGSSIPTQVATNHYSPTDVNAYYPRIKTTDAIDNVVSNFWLVNASYLKLKNLQLGYTVPQNIITRFSGKALKSLNIYVTGENMFTLSGFKIGDPELGGIGTTYPIMKQYSLGINAKF